MASRESSQFGTSFWMILSIGSLILFGIVLNYLNSNQQILKSDAAKGGNKGNNVVNNSGSTITLDQAGTHYIGDTVSFTVSTSTTDPWVRNQCSQSGKLVYAQWKFVVSGNTGPFTLGPTPSWVSGGADCKADVMDINNWENQKVVATTSYYVTSR